jgi:aryl-alcohol dehydrogenase-like predicted oxidoreductase
MQNRILGSLKTPISAIGLGCMGMSEFYGPTDDAQAMSTMVRALELGLNFFDSADIYGFGHNETLIGQFLKAGGPMRRAQVVLATKFGIVRARGAYERLIDNTPAYVQSACEASLKRLGVEAIDVYYCHRRNPDVPVEDMVGAMATLVKAGKVKQLGLSEVSSATLRKAHAAHPIAAVQSEYSLWAREPETDMLATCAELGTTFVAYSPLGRAFLTGALDKSKLAANDFRNMLPRFSGAASDTNLTMVDGLSRFAKTKGMTNAQVALSWLLCKHPHVVPIPGTRRINYLEQNAAAANFVLSEAEIAELDALFPPEAVQGGRYPEAGMVGIE